jgi:LemA protein
VELIGWGLFAALLLAGIWLYNRLVHDRNTVLAAWSDIDVQLKRRHDLIPKLVEAVKAYSGYEQSTVARVTELRAAAAQAARPGEAGRLENELTGALHRLIAVAESYPDLKASEQYLALMRDISQVEKDIQHARRYYNGAVKRLNVLIQSVPSNIVAGLFGFTPAEYFDAGLP